MMVELGETEVLEGKMAKALDGVVGRNFTSANFTEEFFQRLGIHGSGFRDCRSHYCRSHCRWWRRWRRSSAGAAGVQTGGQDSARLQQTQNPVLSVTYVDYSSGSMALRQIALVPGAAYT